VATFTPERRGKLLGLLEAGRTVEDAAAAAGVSGYTVHRWARKGRVEEGTEAAGFAERFDAVREGRGDRGLSEADVVRLVEISARGGSVQAQKVLLDRFQRQSAPVGNPTPGTADEFDELKERRRARG
jgi:hypothetical protein